jgi:hypothetical protein
MKFVNIARKLATQQIQPPQAAWKKFVFYVALFHIFLCGMYPGYVTYQLEVGKVLGAADVASAVGMCFVILPLCLVEFGLRYGKPVFSLT